MKTFGLPDMMEKFLMSVCLILCVMIIGYYCRIDITRIEASEGGNLEATESVMKKGDLNCDGAVNLKDCAILKRYLAGWEIELDNSVADLNRDDDINMKDIALMKRYLAGWGLCFDNELEYEMKRQQIELKTTEGKTVAVVTFEYPLFADSGIAAEKINTYFEKMIELYTFSSEETNLAALEMQANHIETPVYDTIKSEVCYNNGKISVCVKYTGKLLLDSDETIIECMNYDILTGNKLAIDDILNGSIEDQQKVYQNYLAKHDENGNVEQLINSNYCMREDGICVFYYMINKAEYEEIIIPYTFESE